MKKLNLYMAVVLVAFSFITQAQDRYVSSNTHIKFYSTTPVEDTVAAEYNIQ